MLLARGHLRVADIYFTEFIRRPNHGYFHTVAKTRAEGAPPPADGSPTLTRGEVWLQRYAPRQAARQARRSSSRCDVSEMDARAVGGPAAWAPVRTEPIDSAQGPIAPTCLRWAHATLLSRSKKLLEVRGFHARAKQLRAVVRASSANGHPSD
nr:hypothetical protein [Delftia acidovorans]